MHIDLFQRLEIGSCSVTALLFTKMGPRLLALNELGTLAHLKPKPEEPAENQSAPEAQASNAAQASDSVSS